jgi:hypothetical protein
MPDIVVTATSTTTTGPSLPAKVNLPVYRGDSWQQTFRLLQGDEPLDLTSMTIASQARGTTQEVYDLVAVPVGDPSQGVIQLERPTDDLPADLYDYDIELTDPGNVVTTWIHGRLKVSRDVTNEQP